MPLYFAPVEPADFSFLHFYEEYCWLIDFTVATTFVSLVSFLVPEQFKWSGEYLTDNFDLSLFWISLGALFCSVTLIRLSSRYLGKLFLHKSNQLRVRSQCLTSVLTSGP